MISNKNQRGFTLVELMVVVVVFAIVAYGIMNFFSSQSANVSMQSATSQIMRSGQGISNFIRLELVEATQWCYADATVMRFQTRGEFVQYEYNASNKTLYRKTFDTCNGSLGGTELSSVELSPNVSSVDFHYYLGGTGAASAIELPRPVPVCSINPKDCETTLLNIRETEARFVVETRNAVYPSGSPQARITSDDPLTTALENDGKLRRLFTVRVTSRNLYQVGSNEALESGCGSVRLEAVGGLTFASCEADGETATIRATTLAPNSLNQMVATTENTVNIYAVYKTDSNPVSKCANATCSTADTETDDPSLSPDQLASGSRDANGSGTVVLTSDADQAGNQIIVSAEWLPPVTEACPYPPVITSNQLVFNIKGGSPARLKTSGTAINSSQALGAQSASVNTCPSARVGGGCPNSSTTVKVQLLDKCWNPLNGYAVKFKIVESGGVDYGSFSATDTLMNEITVSNPETGIYATSVFAPDSMPPGGVIPVDIELASATITLTGHVDIPLTPCDIPASLELVNPASGNLPESGTIQACPGYSTTISFKVKNACGDTITSSSNPALSPSNNANWNISLDSALGDAEEARQIGTLEPIGAGGAVYPTRVGDTFQIQYKTGGTGLPASAIDTSYCGADRTDVPINIRFTPISQTKTVLLDLVRCPPFSALLDILNPPTCSYAGGPDEACIFVGCPNDTSMDLEIQTTIMSCPTAGGEAIPLDNSGVILVANNPNDGNLTYPYWREAGSQRNYLTVFGEGSGVTAIVTGHLNSGSLVVSGSEPLMNRIDVRALVCFPGGDGVLQTTPAHTACDPGDLQYESTNVLYFWAGPSPAGFMNKWVTPETFVQGYTGIFRAGVYDSTDQLVDPSKAKTYGPVVESPSPLQTGEVYFEVKDCDENKNHSLAETVPLNLASLPAFAGDSETVTLTETGPNTGIFRGSASLKRFSGALQSGYLDVVLGDEVSVTYTDPNDPSDTMTNKFFTTGCRKIEFLKANGGLQTEITPSSSSTAVSDTSTQSDVYQRHAFHIRMYLPEKSSYAYNTTSGETAIVHLRTNRSPDLYSTNDDDYIHLIESSLGGTPDNNGFFRVDGTYYAGRRYVFVSNDPLNLDPCSGVQKDICLGLDDTPNYLELRFDQDSQTNIVSADCSATLTVRDVDKPRVIFSKVSMGSPSGAALSNGDKVHGVIYIQGTVDDGNGTISPPPGIIVSLDGGLTYTHPASYTVVPGSPSTFLLTLDTNSLPDDLYTIKVRASDVNGNIGYSTDDDPPNRPFAGLGTLTIIVDNVQPDTIEFVPAYPSTNICGTYTFTVDATAFPVYPPSDRRVDFFLDGNPTPIATVTPDANNRATLILNVDDLSNLDYHNHILVAEAYDVKNPAVRISTSTNFYVDERPPQVWVSYIDSFPDPLSGTITVPVYTSGCHPVTSVQAYMYLVSPLNQAGPVSAVFDTCYYYNHMNQCSYAKWRVTFNTNPSSCSTFDGFTGDGVNAVHASATNDIGKTGDSATDSQFDLDNPPQVSSVQVPSPVTGDGYFEFNVKDCDGVADDKVKFQLTNVPAPYNTPMDMSRVSGDDYNGSYGLTLSTNDFPVCDLGSGYIPDGYYEFAVRADDQAPPVTCQDSSGTNRCGKTTGSFYVNNPPENVNIQTINGAAPGSTTVSGIITIVATAEDCGFLNGLGDIYIVVDGNSYLPLTEVRPGLAPWNQYILTFDTSQVEPAIGTHSIQVEFADVYASVDTPSYNITIDNRPDCRIASVGHFWDGKNLYIRGWVLNVVTSLGVVGQDVTVQDSAGTVRNAVSDSSGLWVVNPSFYYANGKDRDPYTINMVVPDSCKTCTNCPYIYNVTP